MSQELIAIDLGESLKTTGFSNGENSYLCESVILEMIGDQNSKIISQTLTSFYSKMKDIINPEELNIETINQKMNEVSLLKRTIADDSLRQLNGENKILAITLLDYKIEWGLFKHMYFIKNKNLSLALDEQESKTKEKKIYEHMTIHDYYRHYSKTNEEHNKIHRRIHGHKYIKCQGIKNDSMRKLVNLIGNAISYKFPGKDIYVIGYDFNKTSFNNTKEENKRIQMFPSVQFRAQLSKWCLKNNIYLIRCSEHLTSQVNFSERLKNPSKDCFVDVEYIDNEKYSGVENAHTFAAKSFHAKVSYCWGDSPKTKEGKVRTFAFGFKEKTNDFAVKRIHELVVREKNKQKEYYHGKNKDGNEIWLNTDEHRKIIASKGVVAKTP
jgi:hypothetical protein